MYFGAEFNTLIMQKVQDALVIVFLKIKIEGFIFTVETLFEPSELKILSHFITYLEEDRSLIEISG